MGLPSSSQSAGRVSSISCLGSSVCWGLLGAVALFTFLRREQRHRWSSHRALCGPSKFWESLFLFFPFRSVLAASTHFYPGVPYMHATVLRLKGKQGLFSWRGVFGTLFLYVYSGLVCSITDWVSPEFDSCFLSYGIGVL